MLWTQRPGTSWNRTFFSLDPSSIIAHPESKTPAWGSVLQGDSCPVLPTHNIRILTTMVIVRVHMVYTPVEKVLAFSAMSLFVIESLFISWGTWLPQIKTIFPIISCKLDVAIWLSFGYWNANRNGVCNFWKVLFHFLPFLFFCTGIWALAVRSWTGKCLKRNVEQWDWGNPDPIPIRDCIPPDLFFTREQ